MATDLARTEPRDQAALWGEFSLRLRAFVQPRLPPAIEADDVLQDIFLRIARQGAAVDQVQNLDAWIYQVARSALTDALRSHQRRESRLADVEVTGLPSEGAGEASVVGELTPCLTPFIRRLSEPYRSALEWTALEGLTQQEAATRAGISLSGMKSRVQRAREQIRVDFLKCCALERDAQGVVMDYDVRDSSICGSPDRGASDRGSPANGCGSSSCGPD